MERGYVKLYRKSVDNALFKKPLVWHFWQYCLIRANHTDQEIEFNGKPLFLKRGSFVMSLKSASRDTGLSVQNIRSAIKSLYSFSMLEKSTQQLTKQATLITVCNYSLYQSEKNKGNTVSNKVPTKCQQSANKVPTTDNNVKNVKHVKKEETYTLAFESWWKSYPARNGRKVGKQKSKNLFLKIKESDWQDLKTATDNYAKESNGYAKDPERFLRNGFWKDYVGKPVNGARKNLTPEQQRSNADFLAVLEEDERQRQQEM